LRLDARLSNIGIGHGTIDAGCGYTYFNGHSPNEPKAQIPSIINPHSPDNVLSFGVTWAIQI
jgi:hypothetical protein